MTGEVSYKPHAIGAALVIAAGLVMHFEGKRNVAYSDPPGIETICFGHAHDVKKGDIATDAQCAQYLESDLDIADNAVKRMVKAPMTIQQEAAFADFVYNEGAGTFQRSSMLRDFNSRATAKACEDLKKYVYAGSEKLPGLVKRREAEFELCILGVAQ